MKLPRRFPQWLIHAAAIAPFLWVLHILALNGGGPNPVQYLEQRSGDYALALLLASLACTPLRTLTGWKRFTLFRKPLGLYAFGYAAIHLLLFIGLDYGFAWGEIIRQITEKIYLWTGLIAFLLLIPLALTSTQRWKHRLKKLWTKLHILVFPAALIAILHFALSQKGNIFLLRGVIFWPLAALILLVCLLIMRLRPVRNFLSRHHL